MLAGGAHTRESLPKAALWSFPRGSVDEPPGCEQLAWPGHVRDSGRDGVALKLEPRKASL